MSDKMFEAIEEALKIIQNRNTCGDYVSYKESLVLERIRYALTIDRIVKVYDD